MQKKILSWGIVLISFIVLSTMAYAIPAVIEEVRVDDNIVNTGATNVLELERGQEVEIRIRLKGQGIAAPDKTLDHVQVEAEIKGTEFRDVISATTESFKLKEGVSRVEKLSLRIPSRLEQDRFKLRVRVEDRNGTTLQNDYEIEIASKRHQVTIKDIVMSPENEVKAGSSLLTSLRIKNTGQRDQKGIKAKISIPELGISATDYVNEIEKEDDDNDQVTTNDIFLRIPEDAETGVYTLKADVYFRDGDEVTSKETKVRVIGKEKAQAPAGAITPSVRGEEKTVIFVPIESQPVKAGSQTAYAVTITNSGGSSRAYAVNVDGLSWGTFSVAPSTAVINAGDTKTFTINVAAKSDAPAGDQMFLVTVKSDDKVLKQIPMRASISRQPVESGAKLETVLKVLAVVVLAILVTIGLIFIFSRLMRKDGEGGNGKAETEPYY